MCQDSARLLFSSPSATVVRGLIEKISKLVPIRSCYTSMVAGLEGGTWVGVTPSLARLDGCVHSFDLGSGLRRLVARPCRFLLLVSAAIASQGLGLLLDDAARRHGPAEALGELVLQLHRVLLELGLERGQVTLQECYQEAYTSDLPFRTAVGAAVLVGAH